MKMRISIRQGVFETNSSSVHSAVIVSPEVGDRYEAGGLIVTEKVREEVRKSMGLKVGDVVEYGDVIKWLRENRGEDLRSKLEYWDAMGFDMDDLLDGDEEFLREFPMEDRLTLLRYNGFWSREGIPMEVSYMREERLVTPDGEDVYVICCNGYS